MLEGLQQLLELQRLDAELRSFESEKAGLPGKRGRIAEERAASEAKLASSRTALAEAEGAQRKAEAELREAEALHEKLEGQQHQVKSNDAYTVLLQEMEQARRGISDCETRILEAMEAIEKAGSGLATAERGAAEMVARLDETSGALDAREKEVAAEIDRLHAARDEVRPHLDEKLLVQYEKIASRRFPAVVLVQGEICLGCRVDIPPQRYIEILRGERVIACGNCHRILIHSGEGA